ncbi:phage tail sheath subtilisin-like domain-containing protein [Sphingomonas sp.]|uniref:phage tail sheath subtilisin-like domain-containing protein n=1 Tax=Sphingomonas sp. TaxID=28214 RepID=UPI002EDA9090
MTFLHGISVTEAATAARSLAIVATGVIGLVVTAPAADGAAFPLNTRIKIAPAGIVDAIEKIGATGTGRSALEAIATHVRTPIVLVRVAPGVAAGEVSVEEATDINVIAGLQLLLGAEAQLGIKPRILGAPGLDSEDVADELAEVAKKLRAFAYARCQGDTVAEMITYRESFDRRELMLIAPDFLVKSGAGTVTSFAVAHALGMRARIDQEYGWHKTLSNVPVDGVVGMTEDVSFDFQSVDTDANQLNEAGITTIVSINGALRFWGNRTCADPATDAGKDFVFETATRTAQILADTIALGMIWAIDKPLTPGLARDIIERINETFRQLARPGAAQRILGATAWFDADMNPVDNLKAGKLLVRYNYTPVPPLENLNLRQEITDEYLADFAELVALAA